MIALVAARSAFSLPRCRAGASLAVAMRVPAARHQSHVSAGITGDGALGRSYQRPLSTVHVEPPVQPTPGKALAPDARESNNPNPELYDNAGVVARHTAQSNTDQALLKRLLDNLDSGYALPGISAALEIAVCSPHVLTPKICNELLCLRTLYSHIARKFTLGSELIKFMDSRQLPIQVDAFHEHFKCARHEPLEIKDALYNRAVELYGMLRLPMSFHSKMLNDLLQNRAWDRIKECSKEMIKALPAEVSMIPKMALMRAHLGLGEESDALEIFQRQTGDANCSKEDLSHAYSELAAGYLALCRNADCQAVIEIHRKLKLPHNAKINGCAATIAAFRGDFDEAIQLINVNFLGPKPSIDEYHIFVLGAILKARDFETTMKYLAMVSRYVSFSTTYKPTLFCIAIEVMSYYELNKMDKVLQIYKLVPTDLKHNSSIMNKMIQAHMRNAGYNGTREFLLTLKNYGIKDSKLYLHHFGIQNKRHGGGNGVDKKVVGGTDEKLYKVSKYAAQILNPKYSLEMCFHS